MNKIDDGILNITQIMPESKDYRGKDGLLYCGKCCKPKEKYFSKEVAAWLGRDRRPAECDCRRIIREKREAEETRCKHQEKVEWLKKQGFVNTAMQSWTFANDNGRCPQIKYAHAYVDHWKQVQAENHGMVLWGKIGTGKSYLAGCIANALMEQEIPVYMTDFALMLNALKTRGKERSEYISHLCSFPLLILDDFGMEYGLGQEVYNVIDSRYRSNRPLIVTTNLTLEELQYPDNTTYARIYNRLLTMCSPVCIDGENLRKAMAQEKRERLKILLNGNENCA